MTDANILIAIGRLTFVFAKTMPEVPHEYVIRTKENWDDFAVLWQVITERSEPGTFTGTDGKTRRYRYFYAGDGWRYWRVGLPMLINRAKVPG